MLRENELQDISDKVYLICKTYVYESQSYRDKETKQPRARRKLIGRIDEATGEIVPTRKKAKDITTTTSKDVATYTVSDEMSSSAFLETIKEKDETIKSLRAEVSKLRRERERLSSELLKLSEGLRQ